MNLTPAQARILGSLGALGIGAGIRYWREARGRRVAPRWTVAHGVHPMVRGSTLTRGKKRKLPKKLKPAKTKDEQQDRQIKEIKEKLGADMGTHIHRARSVSQQLQAVKTSTMTEYGIYGGAAIEAALANLKYYDPSTPGTLLTAPIATGSFSKQFIVSFYSKNVIRNNYVVPVRVKAYIVAPKSDTSLTALDCYTDGLADVGSPTATSSLVYLTDSPVFNKLWKIVKSKTKVLQGGQEMVLKHFIPKIKYDPSYADAHTSSYKPSEGALRLLVRIEGVLSHDSANTLGTGQCGVDVMQEKVTTVKYQAGADILQITIDDTQGAMAGNVYSTSKPVADNVQYSVT